MRELRNGRNEIVHPNKIKENLLEQGLVYKDTYDGLIAIAKEEDNTISVTHDGILAYYEFGIDKVDEAIKKFRSLK